MALQKSITIPAGTNLSAVYPDFAFCSKNVNVDVPNAYLKIASVDGTKDSMNITVRAFTDRDNPIPFDYQKIYTFIPLVSDGAENFIKQGYLHLKSLPEYTDAIDLLE